MRRNDTLLTIRDQKKWGCSMGRGNGPGAKAAPSRGCVLPNRAPSHGIRTWYAEPHNWVHQQSPGRQVMNWVHGSSKKPRQEQQEMGPETGLDTWLHSSSGKEHMSMGAPGQWAGSGDSRWGWFGQLRPLGIWCWCSPDCRLKIKLKEKEERKSKEINK